MDKFKKAYCKISVFFAVAAMVISIGLLCWQNVYATGTENNPPLDYDEAVNNIDVPSVDDIEDPEDQRGQVTGSATSDSTNGFTVSYNNKEGTLSGSIRILLTLTIISLLPSILIMVTSFTRIVVVLHFLRAAVGTQSSPPNQVLVGLALFLTFFIMQPVFAEVYTEAIVPYDAGELNFEEASQIAVTPIREFMFEQAQMEDIDVFMQLANIAWDNTSKELVPTSVLIPAFSLFLLVLILHQMKWNKCFRHP